jgi:WD repeat-containing protein 24
VGEMNQQSTLVHTCCGECGKPMLNPGAGWYCSKCKSADSSKCGVCHLIVRGLYAWCQVCGHGGHLQHMKNWFANQSKCPQCDHTCEYE